MLFNIVFTSAIATLAAALALPKRQPPPIWQSPFTGIIVTPSVNQPMSFGLDFPFEYDVSDWCEPAFAPFTVYLTEGEPPVFDNVTATGALTDGAFAFEFGKFVVSRFGLPQQGLPPPASLTLPTLEELDLTLGPDSEFHLAVVEEFDGCPGDIAVEYGLTSVPLLMAV
ncbi:hypothetical protein C8Q79DRAFT_1014528 [Trametes meyenii]|nr:hypothetical protein C8Q79DRAFT_1014528 [Trametes meyenii]